MLTEIPLIILAMMLLHAYVAYCRHERHLALHAARTAEATKADERAVKQRHKRHSRRSKRAHSNTIPTQPMSEPAEQTVASTDGMSAAMGVHERLQDGSAPEMTHGEPKQPTPAVTADEAPVAVHAHRRRHSHRSRRGIHRSGRTAATVEQEELKVANQVVQEENNDNTDIPSLHISTPITHASTPAQLGLAPSDDPPPMTMDLAEVAPIETIQVPPTAMASKLRRRRRSRRDKPTSSSQPDAATAARNDGHKSATVDEEPVKETVTGIPSLPVDIDVEETVATTKEEATKPATGPTATQQKRRRRRSRRDHSKRYLPEISEPDNNARQPDEPGIRDAGGHPTLVSLDIPSLHIASPTATELGEPRNRKASADAQPPIAATAEREEKSGHRHRHQHSHRRLNKSDRRHDRLTAAAPRVHKHRSMATTAH